MNEYVQLYSANYIQSPQILPTFVS